MGKIALIVGPHAVGKTSLFNYAKRKNEVLVFDGYRIPVENLDLSKTNEFIEYQIKYLDRINMNNRDIKESEKHGFVNRSIEESGYYFHFHEKHDKLEEWYSKELNKEENIKVDLVIYLDANHEALKERYSNDIYRDVVENTEWYRNEYSRYVKYWKNYKNVIIVDTTNKTTKDVYHQVMSKLKEV